MRIREGQPVRRGMCKKIKLILHSEIRICHKADKEVYYSTDFLEKAAYKQLLDEVFVISRITKVKVGVISRSRRLRLNNNLDYSGYHKNRV